MQFVDSMDQSFTILRDFWQANQNKMSSYLIWTVVLYDGAFLAKYAERQPIQENLDKVS